MIRTKRLHLRPWKDEDLDPLAQLNADPKVMEYLPFMLSKEESEQYLKKRKLELETKGWGVWAISIPGVADFAGFIGLKPVEISAHFTPSIEIAWRLAYHHWGHGYAKEGASAVLKHSFEILNFTHLISYSASSNLRSRKMMEKIGMSYDPEGDFDHPDLPEGHPLRRHVLYRITQESWLLNAKKIKVIEYLPG